MAVLDPNALGVDRFSLAVVFGSLAVLVTLTLWLFTKLPMGQNAPKMRGHSYPLLGSLRFFTERFVFMNKAAAMSPSRNFSFYAGQWPVVSIDAKVESNRKLFFDSKGLHFNEGYGALLGGSPQVTDNNNPLGSSITESDPDFGSYMVKRLTTILKGNQFKSNLPKLLADVRRSMDALATDSGGITNPFESVYEMVYQLTMRTVACNEVADDRELLMKTLRCFEMVEKTSTPMAIMWPWMPVPAKFIRMYGGYKLYTIFKKIVDNRNKNGIREDDALQFLMDQGDSMTLIIQFVLGGLFAGQLNSGVNAAWILVYLAQKPEWLAKVREEVEGVAEKWTPGDTRPLKERLMDIPIEGWEGDFPLIDLCLRDSIRLQLLGVFFRRNTSGQDIPLDKAGKEVIPNGAFVAMSQGDVHWDSDVYKDPGEWDPSRYFPERAEDKKSGAYSFFGWGLGRHPCLGMRFAKLENNLLVSFFVAYFDDVKLSDANGNVTDQIPKTDRNSHTAQRPHEPVYLKYKVR